MSNRTDFEALAGELARQFEWSAEARTRVETELHNAFVAGQETANQVVWAARRIRDGYPVDARGSYYDDLCVVLTAYDAEKKAGSETIRSTAEPVVHVLHHGRPLCGFSAALFPKDWPPGHLWARKGEPEANCVDCLKVIR